MIIHYIKVAFRNIAKYKTQTIISVLSIGVSVAIFSLISTVMLHITSDPFSKQYYSERVAIIFGQGDPKGNNGQNFIIKASGPSDYQFKTVERLFLPDYKKKNVMVSADGDDCFVTKALRIDSDFLEWGAYKSAITGCTPRHIGTNEVVITGQLAKKLFGNIEEAIGSQIKVQYSDENISELRRYRIIDVLSPYNTNILHLDLQTGILHSDDFSSDYEAMMCYVQMKPGRSYEDVAEELGPVLNIPPDRLKIWSYYGWDGRNNMVSVLISRAVILFLYLFLLVSLSSALRQWIQLFGLRHREIAIRKSLGSKKVNVLWLFVTEELISLTAASVVTLICCLLAVSFFKSNFLDFADAIGFDGSEVHVITLYCYLSIIIICLVADWYAVKRISPDKSGLALQMKSVKHRLRNVGICVQIIISIIFLSITGVFSLGFGNIERYLGIPSDKSRYEAGFLIKGENIPKSQIFQIVEELRRTKNINCFVNNEPMHSTILAADSTEIGMSVFIQAKNEVVTFYGLELNDLISQSLPLRGAFVDSNLRSKMIDTGDWNNKKITLDGVQYDICGWYENMPFQSDTYPSVVLTDPAKVKNERCDFYILPKEGLEKEAKEELKSLIESIAPDRLDIYPKSLDLELFGGYKAMNSIRWIIYILLCVSLLTTVATVYATINLDTRRRRKEMALRKINGAKSNDIARIFAKTYLVIMCIAVCFAVPISVVAIVALNEYFYFGVSPLLATLIAVVLCLLTVYLTLFWKIKEVMNVDPVAYLKD